MGYFSAFSRTAVTAGPAQEPCPNTEVVIPVGDQIVICGLHFNLIAVAGATVALCSIQEFFIEDGDFGDIYQITLRTAPVMPESMAVDVENGFPFLLVSPFRAVGVAGGLLRYRLAVTSPGGTMAYSAGFHGYTQRT